jgi:hypothetical protein
MSGKTLPLFRLAAATALAAGLASGAFAQQRKPKQTPVSPARAAQEDQSFLYLDRQPPSGRGAAGYIGLSNSKAASPINPLMLGQDTHTWLVRP